MQALLNKYGNNVADYDVFKGFTIEGKWVLLQHWKDQFGNKKIREVWGLAPSPYYAISNKLKQALKKKGIDPDKGPSIEGYTMPGSTQNTHQRRDMKNVIEAEYSVEEKAPTPPSYLPELAAAQPVKEASAVLPMINFDISDDAASISERLTVIASLLKLEKGTLRLKIEVQKEKTDEKTTRN